MKRICYLLMGLLLLVSYGCSDNKPEIDDGGGTVPPAPEPDAIIIQDALPTVTEEGGTVTVSFITNRDWTVSATEARAGSWFFISPQNGVAGKAELTITFEPNEGHTDRGIDVVITAGTVKEAFNVVQKKKGALILTPEVQTVPEEGGVVDVIVKTNHTTRYDRVWLPVPD